MPKNKVSNPNRLFKMLNNNDFYFFVNSGLGAELYNTITFQKKLASFELYRSKKKTLFQEKRSILIF